MNFHTLFANGELKISSEALLSDLKPSENFPEVVNSIQQSQQYLTSLKVVDIISWLDAICISWSDRQSEIQKIYLKQKLF